MAKWWTLLKIMIACLSVLPVAVPIKSEEHRDVLADLELADLEPLNSGPKDNTEAEINPAKQLPSPQAKLQQSSPAVKDKDFSFDYPKHSTDQSNQPSEPVEPHMVEIKLPDVDWNGDKDPSDVNADNINRNNSVISGHSDGMSEISDSITLNDENDEDDRSYGNPPVLSDSDKLDLVQKIPVDLSAEEREEWRQNLSKSLGLSALDPGLAMLPVGQNVHTQPSDTRTSSTASATPTTVATSTTSKGESSKFQQDNSHNHEGGMMMNIINNIVKDNPTEELRQKPDGSLISNNSNKTDFDNSDNDLNDFKPPESGYEQTENYGRKVLNEENGDFNTTDTDDDYEFSDADRYFFDDFDEDEDDYVGGEVFISASPKDKAVSQFLSESDQMGDLVKHKSDMPKDNFTDFDEANKSPEQVSEERKDPKQINTDNSYNYEEDANDDWYYNPEDMTEVYTGTTVDPRHRVPFQNEGAEDAEYEDRLSGTKTQIGAPEFEEGIVSKEDIHTKKVLQAPKGTIILYTAVVVILIAFIVLFSVWKNPFKNGRPGHQPPIVRTGEEGKRLLDHPFV